MILQASPRRPDLTINLALRCPHPLVRMTEMACAFHAVHDAVSVLDRVVSFSFLPTVVAARPELPRLSEVMRVVRR